MNHRAFSLIELLVALVLLSVFSGVTTRLLVSAHRTFALQMERADYDAKVRQATSLFQAEFRGLDSGDTSQSDIERIAPDAIAYKPGRTLRFLCRRPDTLNGILTTWEPFFGVRDLRIDLDSLTVPAVGYHNMTWRTYEFISVGPATCPGDVPGKAIELLGADPSFLAAVPGGAPVVAKETIEIRSYRDGRGDWWIGLRRFQKDSNRWPSIQPVLGRLTPSGLHFDYVGSDGGLVTNHTDVAGIRVRISLRNADPFARWRDRESTIEVALRGRGGR